MRNKEKNVYESGDLDPSFFEFSDLAELVLAVEDRGYGIGDCHVELRPIGDLPEAHIESYREGKSISYRFRLGKKS